MANLTRGYNWIQKAVDYYPTYQEIDGEVGITFYQGGLVYQDTDGVLQRIPAAAAATPASAGIEACGWANTSADGYLVPTSQAQKIPVLSGMWWAKVNSSTSPVDESRLRKVVYAENDHTVRADDGGGVYPIAGVLYSMQDGVPQVRVGGPNVEASATGSLGAFKARGVYFGNASLSAFDVDNTNADGLTYAEGETVLLVAQTTAEDCGPWVVGAVTLGVAPLTRPAWWPDGGTIQNGIVIEVGAGGTVYGGSTWKAMCTGENTIGTDDPLFYPKTYTQTLSLASGTYTIGLGSTATPDEPLFLFSATKSIPTIVRVGGTPHSSTVQYSAPTRTAGKAGTAALVVRADVAAGTINASDASDLAVSLTNW